MYHVCCAFCKLRRNFEFFYSVNHSSGPLRKHMFTCDWCISIQFVCFCVSRFIACDHPLLGNNNWLVFFKDFSDLSYSCLLQEWRMSASSPLQKVHSSSRFPPLFFSSLESFSVLFLLAKLDECFVSWFAVTPPPLKWLTEQKNPFEVCKHAALYNEFGYKTSKYLLWKVCSSAAYPKDTRKTASYPLVL